MTDPSFFDVVLRQRACRDFTDAPVPDGEVERILDAATHAPSGENTQPWVFVVVRDDVVRAQVVALTQRVWSMARGEAMSRLDARLGAEVDTGFQSGFGGAPVLVVVGADTTTGVHPRAVPSSIFPAVQNLLLAANALGYGSALTTLTAAAGDELRAIVELPDHIIPVAVVPIGRSARPLGPPRRRPARDTTYRDRFGTPW
jgi:nitroreductase